MVTETMPDRTTPAMVHGAGGGTYIAGELRFVLEEDAREESQTFRVFEVSGQPAQLNAGADDSDEDE